MAIRKEVAAYGHGLQEKSEIVALNKIDAIEKPLAARRQKALERVSGKPVFLMSGVSGEGVLQVLHALAREVDRQRARARRPEPANAWAP